MVEGDSFLLSVRAVRIMLPLSEVKRPLKTTWLSVCRSPDRTGVCCAGVGTLSAHKMTTGRVSHQPISPIKGQIVIYRPSIGPDSLRDAVRATFVGDWVEPSGESRPIIEKSKIRST